MDLLLCGDIGGTHTRLALVKPGALDAPLAARVYPSRDFPALQPLVARFLADVQGAMGGATVRSAAFGIPGPVSAASEDLWARDDLWMSNLPWRIRPSEVAQGLGLKRVRFLNDFTAVALSVQRIGAHHLHPLGGGPPDPSGPVVVLGAGTGLGIGFLVRSGARTVAVSSEGSHADFAPRGAQQQRLLAYVQGQSPRGQVWWEEVLSGRGLVHLYEFLRDSEGVPEAPAVRSSFVKDPPAAITRHGLPQDGAPLDPLCTQALDLFCALYGAVAANLTLTVVATGGVYLAGGMSQHVLPALGSGAFRTAFNANAKPEFAELLSRIPVWVITHPNPGLLGAALAAEEALGNQDS